MKEYVSEGSKGKWVRLDKKGVHEYGEVEVYLLWPPLLGMLPEGARHQSY